MRIVVAIATLLAVGQAALDAEFQDSPALTSIWQATSTGETESLVDVYVQNRDFGLSRADDGRGPLFWAYEFKNSDALALLMHLDADEEGEDVDGKQPRDFFPDGAEDLAEFQADAESKIDEMAALLKQRVEEFSSYSTEQQESLAEDEGTNAKGNMDEIDYDDDEEDEDEEEQLSTQEKARLEALRAKSRARKDEV